MKAYMRFCPHLELSSLNIYLSENISKKVIQIIEADEQTFMSRNNFPKFYGFRDNKARGRTRQNF
jgi:hypothetical protein